MRRELERRGFRVFVPAMPNTMHPKMDSWVNHLAKTVGKPDKDCYFVGHSLGAITILRYLETLKPGQRVGGAILIAGFDDNLGYEELNSFFASPVEWDKIKSRSKKFVAIHSDDDPYVPLKHSITFKEKLGAESIVMHNMKHFSGDEGFTELPIALDVLLKITASRSDIFRTRVRA